MSRDKNLHEIRQKKQERNLDFERISKVLKGAPISTQDDTEITRGMQDYIDKNNKYLVERSKYIEDTVRKWKFDTI